MKKLLLLCFFLIFTFGYSQSKKELKTINKAVNEITKKIDDFDNTITWRSPIYGKGLAAATAKRVSFIKVKDKKGDYTNYLSLTTYGTTLNVGEKGLVLLFEDGTRFERPNAKVDSEVDSDVGYWRYSIFERISDDELDMFATKKVDKFRLYIYDGKPINKKSVLKVMGYARGIKEVK